MFAADFREPDPRGVFGKRPGPNSEVFSTSSPRIVRARVQTAPDVVPICLFATRRVGDVPQRRAPSYDPHRAGLQDESSIQGYPEYASDIPASTSVSDVSILPQVATSMMGPSLLLPALQGRQAATRGNHVAQQWRSDVPVHQVTSTMGPPMVRPQHQVQAYRMVSKVNSSHALAAPRGHVSQPWRPMFATEESEIMDSSNDVSSDGNFFVNEAYPLVYDGRMQGAVPAPQRGRTLGHGYAQTRLVVPSALVSKDDYVEGGEELIRPGTIPTPARSKFLGMQRSSSTDLRDACVQANRTSIDGHAAAAAERAFSQGRLPRKGDDNEEMAMTPPPLESGRSRHGAEKQKLTRFKDLKYPSVEAYPATPSLDSAPSCGPRAALAQVLSVATAEEMGALSQAWNLGDPSRERSLEEAVAGFIRGVSRRAEKNGVLRSLRRPVNGARIAAETSAIAVAFAEGEEAASLQAHIASLEAELKASQERICRIDEYEANLRTTLPEEPHRGLQELLHKLCEEEDFMETNSYASSIRGELQGKLEEYLKRLSLVDLWFHRTTMQLEETQKELAEREEVAASRAFEHLPGKAPSAQRALSQLP